MRPTAERPLQHTRPPVGDQSCAPWEIGSIYTATLIPKLAGEVMTDLYPTLGQAPGFDGIYRMTTGRQAP